MGGPVQIADGVWRIPVGVRDMLNVFVVVGPDDDVTLVDCGVRRAAPRVLAGLRHVGAAVEDVTAILLTHAHADHAGGVSSLQSSSGAAVATHADEACYVRSGVAPPLDRSLLAGRLLRRPGRFRAVEVSRELSDGERLNIAGGIRVVHTPGHTPGHASYLHEPSGTLLAGDALYSWRGRARWPIPFLCSDVRQARRSARVLAELDFHTVGFGHGSEIRGRGRAEVRALLDHSSGGRR